MNNHNFPNPANEEQNSSAAGRDTGQPNSDTGKWQEMPGERKNNDQPPGNISTDDKEMHNTTKGEEAAGSPGEKTSGSNDQFVEMKGERMNNDQDPSSFRNR